MSATGQSLSQAPTDDARVSTLNRVPDVGDGATLVDLPGLVASAEPSVVFASMAAQCVPDLCDQCSIDIVEGLHARYRIVYPPPSAALRVNRVPEHFTATPDHVVQVHFDDSPHPDAAYRYGDAGLTERFHGTATLSWHSRGVGPADRTMAALLVQHAVRTVLWQRAERYARDAAANAKNLQIALQSSRHIGSAIGILMCLHKITQDEAFELLRLASQRRNRKLRDLALDVIDAGWLDPAKSHPHDPRATAPAMTVTWQAPPRER